eukprot:gene10399-13197_t
MGRLAVDLEPVLVPGQPVTLAFNADPMPQALVLTAIVIGFAMTALFLVLLLAQRGFFGGWRMNHLLIAPILLPLVTACLLLLVGDRKHRSQAALGGLALLANLGVALALLVQAQGGGTNAYGVYLPSNWEAPFGIVLVLDRLSGLMLVVAAVVALAALVFSLARWDKAGAHFHVLFQVQVMGINGAFLTGDLFNLFVFFEVMLAASYGLLLHGSGRLR